MQLPRAVGRFDAAYARYWATGEVPSDAGELLFLATWASGGTHARLKSKEHAAAFDPAGFAHFHDALLSTIDPAQAASDLEEFGFHRAPLPLAAEVVDDIRSTLENGPAVPRGDGVVGAAGVPCGSAPTWWMEPRDALTSTGVRQLLGERRLAEVAGSYLRAQPLIMSLALWKSFAWPSSDHSSAQLFHYDNDRSAFVKAFFYLCDVDEFNGPHTYVPRSHREKPKQLLHGGRLGDREVARHFPQNEWVTVTGPKGTVFFADTQGFHKGGQVHRGARAMFQINLASDRFGVSEGAVGSVDDAPADIRTLIDKNERYFAELYRPSRALP